MLIKMISESSQFVWIFPKEKRQSYQPYTEYRDHNGKWIVYDSKDAIEGLGSKMLDLVGKDGILHAKFTRNPALDVPEGYELGKVHALIVYCDGRERNNVKDKLKNKLGVDKMIWKYDRETREEVMRSKVRK
jgi:hypothetical protein